MARFLRGKGALGNGDLRMNAFDDLRSRDD